MSDGSTIGRRHKWMVGGALLLVALVIVTAVAIELNAILPYRRLAQSIADAAALCGSRELGHYINTSSSNRDPQIESAMNTCVVKYALGKAFGNDDNKSPDSGPQYTLIGHYIDAAGRSLGPLGSGSPLASRGLQTTVSLVAPTFFGRIAGRDGWLLKAEAKAQFDVVCEEGTCRAISRFRMG
jgi:hypothetical protein